MFYIIYYTVYCTVVWSIIFFLMMFSLADTFGFYSSNLDDFNMQANSYSTVFLGMDEQSSLFR
jgi:hypothetical protein